MTAPRVVYLLTSAVSTAFIRDQITALAGKGFTFTVATGDPDAIAIDHAEVVGLPFVRDPSPVADIRALWHTYRLLRRRRPDAVIAATPKAGLTGMLAARLARVPRRVYLVWGLRFETLSGWRRRVLRWLERLAGAAATDVLFNSPSLLTVAERDGSIRRGRGGLLGHGGGNCVCMDRFDDLPDRADARRRLGLPADGVIVGFLGRLTRDKGIVDLVEEFGDEPGDLHLVLVGDYESGDSVPEEVRRAIDAAAHITQVPWIDDVRVAYAAIDLLAFASYREGLPNVPIEAQRAGVPVVAYAATGTVDAVHHDVGGRLVDVGDHATLAAELMALASDPDRRAALGRAGRAFAAEQFDPRRCWEHLADLLSGTTARR